MTSAYFMAAVRGPDGETVSDEEKAANVARGIEVGAWLEKKFPTVDLYIPHRHEEVIHELWRDGVPGPQIVRATTRIALRRDVGIAYIGTYGFRTTGMEDEWEAMKSAGKPVVEFVECNDYAFERIARAILKGK